MANTTNFGWETPDDTDLVKDGAAAMRTLGNAIDASLVDLKGGTTNQVLAKNSNTDMDFTWVTTNDADAIQNSIVDAKGDLIAASAADTPARLAVGNNGETLVANSSASVGLSYQEPKAGNPVINSAFQVWQRGTSIALANTSSNYTADRWAGISATTGTISRQTTSDTTNLPNIQYCARAQRTSGQTGTGAINLAQFFESVNSIPFAGKQVTLSFYARAGANYSSASNALGANLYTGTGTDQNPFAVSYTGSANPISGTATLTTTWQRFTYSGTLASTATELYINFSYTPSGTAGAADYFEVTGVQLEVGSVASPFKTQGVTLAGELAACQRYYYLLASGNSLALAPAFSNSNTLMRAVVQLPVTMRGTPSLDASSGTDYYMYRSAAADDLFNSLTIANVGTGCVSLFNNTEIASTSGQGGYILTNNASARVAFTAEL